jgi:hypothetical protein
MAISEANDPLGDRQGQERVIVLAFFWAHVRRDFVRLARSWPDQGLWASGWAAEIGTLHHLDDQRFQVRGDAAAFAEADGALRVAMTRLGNRTIRCGAASWWRCCSRCSRRCACGV